MDVGFKHLYGTEYRIRVAHVLIVSHTLAILETSILNKNDLSLIVPLGQLYQSSFRWWFVSLRQQAVNLARVGLI
jgi:hypothetical protein